MTVFRNGRPVLLGLALAGCSADALDGSVDGVEFGDVQSAFFIVQHGDIEELRLVLANYPEGCLNYTPYFKQDVEPSEEDPVNAFYVHFYLLDPVAAGTYPIVAADETYDSQIEWVHAFYQTYTDDGWAGPAASSGEMAVESLDAELLTGTVSVTLETGDSLEGRFEATVCEVDDI